MFSISKHPKFINEAASFQKRFRHLPLDKAFESFEKLCDFEFHPTSPKRVIAPAKLHRRFDCGIYSIWKIELAVKGLKQNQSPRVWFGLKGTNVVYLVIATHCDNYNDNDCDQESKARVTDFF